MSLGEDSLEIREMMQTALVADLPPSVNVDGRELPIVVGTDLNVFSVDELPLVLHLETPLGGPENDFGRVNFNLTLQVFAIDGDTGIKVSNALYATVRRWRQTRHVPGLGGIRHRENESLFSEVYGDTKIMIGKPIRQFVGVFNMDALHESHFH